MGPIYENITIKNSGDVGNARRGIIKVTDIHQINVRALVSTGTDLIIINEDIRQQLNLDILEKKQVSLANDNPVTCQVTEPVEVHWKDRSTVVNALVLDGTREILLGAIPLEGMNLIVDPINRKLKGIHGDEIIFRV